MKIPLDQFEAHIDSKIQYRGFAYFKEGRVTDFEVITPGVYEAGVKGSDDYTVGLHTENGFVLAHDCDCPYDRGPVCKHVVAAIYYYKEKFLKTPTKPKGKTVANKKDKPKSTAEQVNELLEKVSYEELLRFVREKTAVNNVFRNLFLVSFGHYNSDDSVDFYKRQIRLLADTVSDRHDFFDWDASGDLSRDVEGIIETAQKQLDRSNFRTVINICIAVMEEMLTVMNNADDDGNIGSCIDSACEMLASVAEAPLDEPTRTTLLDYCLGTYKKGLFSGWDWHSDLLTIAGALTRTEEEITHIFSAIDMVAAGYKRDEAQRVKYQIILKLQGEKAADKYLEQNITNSDFRRILLDKAIDRKNYEKAIAMANDGIVADKTRNGLVNDWYDYLLQISQKQENTSKIIEYARFLFLEEYSSRQNYYEILKKTVKKEEWNAFILKIANDVPRGNIDLLTSIYILERWWDKLFEYVKSTPDLHTIEQFEKYLSANYTNEIVALYCEGIIKLLVTGVGRNFYETACRFIRRIIKLGARNTADDIVAYLRAQYPKRPALMQELNRL